MLYLKYDEVVPILAEKLEKRGCGHETAVKVAQVATGISLDGVYSHGINRFKRLVLSIDSGICMADLVAEKTGGFGGFERWDGQRGIGIINALCCTDRAVELAKAHGIGCVALRNTNHWFRAGTYGWRIADAGMIGIVFTNTKSNMVYQGTMDRILGTTPLVISVPRSAGHVVADVSLGEYSYGKLQLAALDGKQMATPAGYDKDGNLSTDPNAVMQEARLLPLGEWKGSALNLLLDLVASSMSLGNSACDVREIPGDENSISQTFIAINSRAINSAEDEEEIVNRLLNNLLNAKLAPGYSSVRYPSQNVIKNRTENSEKGIPVNETVWNDILAL